MNYLILPEQIKQHLVNMQCEQNRIGCSQAGIYKFCSPAKTLYLKMEAKPGELDKECGNILWLQGKLPVPQIVEWVSDREFNYVLLTEISGKMLYDDDYLKNPLKAVSLLAKGIKLLHSININECPIHNNLNIKLKSAAENIRLNRVDMNDWEPENGFSSPQDLLNYLVKNRPDKEELAFTHGDYCLPNIFGNNDEITGFIDLGRVGIADIWQDIALGIRSLWHNFNTKEYDAILLKQIGIPLNKEKLDYYILLDELF